mgnify:CR=1 FL=1
MGYRVEGPDPLLLAFLKDMMGPNLAGPLTPLTITAAGLLMEGVSGVRQTLQRRLMDKERPTP